MTRLLTPRASACCAGVLSAALALDVAGECPGSGRFHVELDDSQAAAVLGVLQAGVVDDQRIAALSTTTATQAAIVHSARFDPRATVENWRNGLKSIILGQKLDEDPFRFNSLYEHRQEESQTLARIEAELNSLEGQIEATVGPYVPSDLSISAVWRVVAGGRAVGWTEDADPDAFYFNLRAGGGDLAGIRTNATHELYHVVLARLLPKPRFPIEKPLGRVERVVLNGIDEGMASHVARYGPNVTGPLSEMSVQHEKENQARRWENAKLIESFVIATYHSGDIAPTDVGRIAFAGAYDEPGYFVFRDMAAAVEATRGRVALLELIRQPPAKFVLAYQDVAMHDPTAVHFGQDMMAIIRRLDAAEPLQAVHPKGSLPTGESTCAH